MIVMASRRKVFFDDDYRPLQNPNSKGKIRHPNTKNLAKMMKCDDEMFVDFVDQCLEWKIEKRMTPEQAFQHPWIKAGIIELKQKIDQQQQMQNDANSAGAMTATTSKVSKAKL